MSYLKPAWPSWALAAALTLSLVLQILLLAFMRGANCLNEREEP